MTFKQHARALHTAIAFIFDEERVKALEDALLKAFTEGYAEGSTVQTDLATAPLKQRIRELEEQVRMLHYSATRDEDTRRSMPYR